MIPTVEVIRDIQEQLRNLRDGQEEIFCDEDDICICNYFDRCIDELDELAEMFEKAQC